MIPDAVDGRCRHSTNPATAAVARSDASPMAIIEFVDRDLSAKGQDSGPVMSDEDFDEAA